MTPEQFNIWEQTQVDRHEFVDGQARLKFVEWDGPNMMVGASEGHNSIVTNLVVVLASQLRGTDCRAYAADGKVRIPTGNYRYPDVTINCGPRDRRAVDLPNPVTVIEVLSKSTYWIDQNRKLRDYQTVPSINCILLLSQDEARGQLWQRGPEGWEMKELENGEAFISFPAIQVNFVLAEAYEGVF